MGNRFGSACIPLFFCLAGCLPYGYPSAAFIPPIHPECDPGQVYAFRVDTGRYQCDADFLTGGGVSAITITPIHVSAEGIGPQARISIDHGILVLTPALSYGTLHSHSVAVRLYRPAYETVEVKEGDRMDTICWKAAPDLAGQEKALDDLFDTGGKLSGLNAGSASAGHRQALLFGASEYDRLAGPPTERGKDFALWRLAEKARKLRELAEK